jgi:anti-sigma B factor antagonist
MDFVLTPVFDEGKKLWNIAVKGEVDIFKSNEFKNELINLVSEKEGSLRLDCAGLEYIDSTGLGALVAVLNRVKEYDGTVSLLNLRPNTYKLFKITALDKIFNAEGDDHNE